MGRVNVRLSPTHQQCAARAMQAAIATILIVGLVELNISVVVNAALALAVTFLPAFLRRDYSIRLHPGLALWITTAVLLHAVGMLGLYSTVWWYDHVTHAFSATIVAGVGYTTVRAIDRHSDAIYLPPRFLSVFVLLFTLAFGVLWEVLEFVTRLLAIASGLEPVLVQYGLDDTVVDLLFDAVGAVLVALFGTHELGDVVDALTERLDRHDRGE